MVWEEIKNSIVEEQTKVIDGLIVKVSKSIGDLSTPRNTWSSPLDEWIREQINPVRVFKLTAQDYSKLKDLVNNLQEGFHCNCGEEAELLNDFREKFNEAYRSVLKSKETDIKIETAAFLIGSTNFNLKLLSDWYVKACKLPVNQFHEATGSFWGDVWRGAAKGATVGGLSAGIPSGGLAGLAGAGVGGLTGAGYGAASHTLKNIWNWRQSLENFESTQKIALDSLKKLKGLAERNYDLNPNFGHFIDTVIAELSKVKPYMLAPKNMYRPTEKAEPLKVPSMETPIEKPAEPVVPPKPATPEEVEKAKMDAAERAKVEKDILARKQAAEREEYLKNLKITSFDDVLKIYQKAKSDNDLQTLARLANALAANIDDSGKLTTGPEGIAHVFEKNPMINKSEDFLKSTIETEQSYLDELDELIRKKNLEASVKGTATGEIPGSPPAKIPPEKKQPEPEKEVTKILGKNIQKLLNSDSMVLEKFLAKHYPNWKEIWPGEIPDKKSWERARFLDKLSKVAPEDLPESVSLDYMALAERVSYFKNLLKS